MGCCGLPPPLLPQQMAQPGPCPMLVPVHPQQQYPYISPATRILYADQDRHFQLRTGPD